jgi:hypothetical protein
MVISSDIAQFVLDLVGLQSRHDMACNLHAYVAIKEL